MKSVTSRRQHRKRSEVKESPDFKKPEKVRKKLGKEIRSFVRETNVGVAIMKLALNKDLRSHSHKRRMRQFLTATVRKNHQKKAKKTCCAVERPTISSATSRLSSSNSPVKTVFSRLSRDSRDTVRAACGRSRSSGGC